MGIPAPTELLLILGIVIMVFGAKRIPEIMGGVASGIKNFKKTMESDESPQGIESAQPLPEAKPSGSAGVKIEPR